MRRFVEWDTVDLRIDGERLNQVAQRFRASPIEALALRFSNGLLRVEGAIRKFVLVPFAVEIAELVPRGRTVAVLVRSATAFGAVPIPRFLFGLLRDRLPRGLVSFEEPATFVVSLDRFLPDFVSADIQNIWIVDGGLAVTLGRGGADLPPQLDGGFDDRRLQ